MFQTTNQNIHRLASYRINNNLTFDPTVDPKESYLEIHFRIQFVKSVVDLSTCIYVKSEAFSKPCPNLDPDLRLLRNPRKRAPSRNNVTTRPSRDSEKAFWGGTFLQSGGYYILDRSLTRQIMTFH